MDCVLTVDIGSSSVRTLLYSFAGQEIADYGSQVEYRARTTSDGGWEMDAGELTGLVRQSLDLICAQLRSRGVKPAAVAVDTFWHSVLGVDGDGNATTAVLHPFDTRSAAAARRLAARVDNRAQHQRTGCVIHPGYVPSKLLWLAETQAEAFGKTRRWMSIGEYLFLQVFGKAAASTSMVSATGFWDQNANDFDAEMLAALPVRREQFADAAEMDQPCRGNVAWPELSDIPWFPALGDGACSNAGSGCLTPECFALMVGTSGAIRAILKAGRMEIPDGLFCYRLDRQRFVTGGALSNGGEVFAWMKRVLRLPEDNEAIEKQLAGIPAWKEKLTILPLFAGERSPCWRADARAVLAGLGTDTTAIEILQAALEAVALRFQAVYAMMERSLGCPREVIASGGALLHSAVWTQMMADALGRAITPCAEPEATSRGAALIALERLGVIRDAADLPPTLAAAIPANSETAAGYAEGSRRQRELYRRLYEGNQ